MNEEALDASTPEASDTGEAKPRPQRRTRRGGRGRSRRPAQENKESQDTQAAPETPSSEEESGKAPASETKRSPARRRRRRRRPSAQRSEAQKSEDGAKEEPGQDGGGRPQKSTRSRKSSGTRKRTGRAPASKQEQGKEPKASSDDEAAGNEGTPARKRRRRRRRKPAGEETAPATRTTEAPSRRGREAPASAAGTRVRRRKVTSRRRPPAVQAPRREDKVMLITEHGERDQIAVVEGRDLAEHYVTRSGARSMVGNIYLGKVQNVLPGMEAAFVDVGRGRNGVLYAGEVSYSEDVEGEERRIEKALKPGQGVLVQVTKDPMGGKGARLTAQISLPGRYLVYVPEGGASGISRRLPDKERVRLRGIVKKVRPSEAGVIVRTAAEGASEEELNADLERLKKAWDSIKRKSRRAKPPKPVYEEPELTVRVVRDVFSPVEFQEIVTDSRDVYEKVVGYLQEVAPDLADRVQLHDGKLSLFESRHVAEQIHKALERKVWLPSGGYLIVERTEAMTIIDVNTGKHVGKSNLEQTVSVTNVEAAKEVARQLRLRDIGGIIVIDFIDMLLEKNQDLVVRTLKEALAMDRTRSQVFEFTPLGLLEMTRKRVSAGLVESFSETCPTCEGRGILLTHDV